MGEMPLPPYIHRQPDAADRERYQTVFAAQTGSVGSANGGLAFHPGRCLNSAATAGAEHRLRHFARGTRNVRTAACEKRIEDIQLHEEHFEIADGDARS